MRQSPWSQSRREKWLVMIGDGWCISTWKKNTGLTGPWPWGSLQISPLLLNTNYDCLKSPNKNIGEVKRCAKPFAEATQATLNIKLIKPAQILLWWESN